MNYGWHVDEALFPSTPPMRSDLSCTVFLNPPTDYDGGELTIQLGAQELSYKLERRQRDPVSRRPPSTASRPVTRGVRLAAITWLQSWVADSSQRELLVQLEEARALAASGGDAEVAGAAGVAADQPVPDVGRYLSAWRESTPSQPDWLRQSGPARVHGTRAFIGTRASGAQTCLFTPHPLRGQGEELKPPPFRIAKGRAGEGSERSGELNPSSIRSQHAPADVAQQTPPPTPRPRRSPRRGAASPARGHGRGRRGRNRASAPSNSGPRPVTPALRSTPAGSSCRGAGDALQVAFRVAPATSSKSMRSTRARMFAAARSRRSASARPANPSRTVAAASGACNATPSPIAARVQVAQALGRRRWRRRAPNAGDFSSVARYGPQRHVEQDRAHRRLLRQQRLDQAVAAAGGLDHAARVRRPAPATSATTARAAAAMPAAATVATPAASSVGQASASVRSGSGSRSPCTCGQLSSKRLSRVEPQWPMWKIASAGSALGVSCVGSSASSGNQPPSALAGSARSSRNAASRRCAASRRSHSTRRPTRSSLKGRNSGRRAAKRSCGTWMRCCASVAAEVRTAAGAALSPRVRAMRGGRSRIVGPRRRRG